MTDIGENGQLTAEQRARGLIDQQLREAGWAVQDRPGVDLSLRGVAVGEVVMASGHGRADHVLYVDRRAGRGATGVRSRAAVMTGRDA